MPLWLSDSLNILQCGKNPKCEYIRSEAGYVTINGINVIYSKTRDIATKFYDKTGNILETVISKINGSFASSGIVSKEEFETLHFDKKWQCGEPILDKN
jgi:hypothetical protein